MTINVNQSPSFDDHEEVVFVDDQSSGLKAIIAIHNSKLGPAVGGCRMFPYASESQALEDVLRLSRGMTYKSALAGLPMGGGKAVIIGDPSNQKTPQLLAQMGEFIESLDGRYISAEDSGINVADLKIMAASTNHVLGINDEQEFGGDPSPSTALGVYHGIKASIGHRFGCDELDGIHVAIQGVGAVGQYLGKLLIGDGAKVSACDINLANLKEAENLGAHIVDADAISKLDADVFAPCAMGAIINDESIANLNAPIIAGAANNQLARIEHGEELSRRGILYAPDFVINAGGIIEICRQSENGDAAKSDLRIAAIGDTLTEIYAHSYADNCATNVVAERLAEQYFKRHPKSTVSTAA